jgi:hypothetical protein
LGIEVRRAIAISLALHGLGALALMWMPAPVRPKAKQAPIELAIVTIEKPKASKSPSLPIESGGSAAVVEKKRGRSRERTVEAPPPAGGGGEDQGTGPVVDTGVGNGDTDPKGGKTKDGRDLSSLDLGVHVEVPRFEDQGPGVVLPPPPKDPRRRSTHGGGWRYDDPTFAAEVAPDGTVTFDGRGHESVDLIPDEEVGGWSIDVNDWILSAAGDDPYSYEKRKFLEATREERLAMARAACGVRLSSSLLELPKRLAAVWQSTQPVEDKRRVLFDLWDECAEDGAPEVLRYGELARYTILDFIQKHLPRDSEDAYTELELDRLNERRASKRRFDPYGMRL